MTRKWLRALYVRWFCDPPDMDLDEYDDWERLR
jgi:hypothetical protein